MYVLRYEEDGIMKEVTVIYAVHASLNELCISNDLDFKCFFDKDQALEYVNQLKDSYQYSDEWMIEDEFDWEDITDTPTTVIYIHRTTGDRMFVTISELYVH